MRRKSNRSHITKVKKLKAVPHWPSQKEVIAEDYPSKDKITLVDLPADITLDPYIVMDEEGEIYAIEQGWTIHTIDSATGRFSRYVNEYTTYMLRHRQRRLQTLVTNSYYMSQDFFSICFTY